MTKTSLLIFACGLALVEAALATVPNAPALQQRTQSFTVVLNGSVADVTSLFGPVREWEWAPDWAPHLIHPAQGAEREGVLFTTASAHSRSRFWLLTTYDVSNGRVEYVIMTAGFKADEIKIRVVPEGELRCKATITYRRSALAPEGNEEVARLNAHWAEQQRIHWQTAINEALAKGSIHD